MSNDVRRPPGAPIRPIRNVRLSSAVALAIALALLAPAAAAQATLGEVLDSGATVMNVADFEREVVQRMLVGPTGAGGDLEIMYTTNGTVEGRGTPPRAINKGSPANTVSVFGRWQADKDGRICTTFRFGVQAAGPAAMSDVLPPRCQFWFKTKAGNTYFLADYDSDRSAKVLRRTLKQ